MLNKIMNLFYKNKGNEVSNPNSTHNSQQVQIQVHKNTPDASNNLQSKLKKNNYKDEVIVPEKSLIDQIFENANEIYENEINNFTKKIVYGKINDQVDIKKDEEVQISDSQGIFCVNFMNLFFTKFFLF
jgi:hypothetical protein